MNPILIGGVVLASVVSVFGLTKIEEKKNLISPVVYISPTITPSPVFGTPMTTIAAEEKTPMATVTPTIKKVVSPKPKPTPTKEPFENVSKLLDKYSEQYGLDVNVVRHLALCESGLRSNATNGKYVGLFQYDSQTWKTIRAQMSLDTEPALRYSAEESIKTTAYALSKGKRRLWPNCVP
ncbi:hypothetical protein A2572_04840 [Candidatus Collierbacteria bacterium RIFOXYD1_FULL_40_9]|uniref:Transglycosylase SLT domain-containing protein n=1 Tax=Candidatus Collierbacteria bacterium RIFOXYD1_FULL_40_9 TaxID=1817731 RepID=A0A1F5FVL8_9BACT|nr:MAG: hypothetical protein A2572_04840 [Candidatus Collierbacteria bacterium RIFOXYD1_FULL_40_9]